ncbi:Hypothetical protein SRAE_2000092600 [Strongyloides ratti]|uniref:ELYS-bb domain-containing protein n=1 Tax=Strongyloides ratti TaxID=34506 RepID=A0A090L914_STRRB|nr:Hypothetical protein SRAE_2000092600 [Strongyloides ratti]CEF66256.1 Hypothetical protein SRAE_2000092600 [Strongyloides ratti]
MSLDFQKPSCLRQRLIEDTNERCNLSCAFGLSEYKNGSLRTGKYLYDCEGKCKYFVVAIEEYLLLYNSDAVYGEPRKRVEYSFGKGAIIHDCALMCLEDNFEGLVVGATTVNETGTKCYGLYLLSAGREAIILDALAFAGDCKKIFVIYDELHQNELKEIHSAFHKIPHLIMVGGEGAAGYLTHFNNTSKENALRDQPPTRPPFALNILRGFRDKTDRYFCFDAYKENIQVKLNEAEVTSIAYVHSCRCLLIGFNFGGILSINLLTQRKNKIIMSRGEIKAMQIQEPDDDPRPASYVWVASLVGRSLSFSLLSLRFYSDPSDPSIVDRNNMELRKGLGFEAGEFCHFLALKAVTRNRLLKADNTARMEDIHKKDTTLMLFSWINFSSSGVSLEGALFDLNMYYYKRMCDQIRDDGTYARQCPMISRFSIDSPSDINFASLLDIHLDPESLYRGKSDLIENVDQFFYPSTYGFELHAFTKNTSIFLSCKPIQFQFFEHLSPLKEHLNDPEMAVRCLTALGFMSVKDYSKLSGRNLIIQLIKDETVAEKHLLPLIDWLYTEIQKCVDHFQKIASKLFEENSEDLYSAQITKVNHYIGVFEMIKEIIIAMKDKDLSDEVNGQLYVKGVVVDTFLFYSRLMNVFVEVGLFPITQEVIELHKKLENVYKERLALSRKKFYKLEIVKLLDLFSQTELNCIEELYPPKNPAVLIDLIVAPEIKILCKTKLISYYALDIGLLRENDSFIDKVQYNVAFFCTEKNPIDFFEIKKLWRQDAIELKDYNANLYTLRQQNFEFDYKNNLTPRIVEMICQRVYISDSEMKDLHTYFLKQPHGLFIWNYIAIKREEFSMIEPLNINILSNVPDEWRVFCEKSKKLYEEAKGCSILWRYKMPSLYCKKEVLKKDGTSSSLIYTSSLDTSQNDNEVIGTNEETKDIDTVVDKDYMDHQFVAQRYENLLKTPSSASRWTRVSRIANVVESPQPEESKQIQPTSIMKSRERVSRLRPGMKIGSRIRFNLPEISSFVETTNGESACSLENDDSMNVSFNGVFQIEKSDEKTELDDVKCVYKTIIQEKIEEQMSKTVRYEDGKVTVMEAQTDEEMLMSDLENSPAQTGIDLINHMEEKSKSYNIELPSVVLVESSKEDEINVVVNTDSTPVVRRRNSCIVKKTLSFIDKEDVPQIDNEDKTNKLKRASPCVDTDDEDTLDIKKTKINENVDETLSENVDSNSFLRRSARIRKQSVEPEIPPVTTTKSKTKRGTASRENSTEPDNTLSSKTRNKRVRTSCEPNDDSDEIVTSKPRNRRGKTSREPSVEVDDIVSSKSRSKRGKTSREPSVEKDSSVPRKTRTKRGKTNSETSVESDAPMTPKSRTRRGSSCEQEGDLRRSTRLRRTPSKEIENSSKKGSKSPSRLPTILESNAPHSEN